ncbi:MAG: 16S rRNA (guanine(527)-N(7))-methyltransferase RsmG [Acidobacteria bacterium]|nr:16S rRNA (guanine(527)-N(7))-methyltransferase RsmG [Acidobacteriota bacterium]
MNNAFRDILSRRAGELGINVSARAIDGLTRHFELVTEANTLLHLTGPVTGEEFAERHTLESLALVEVLPKNAKFIDIGPGGGFPSVPCLIARPDLSATLIESKEKKTKFLSDLAVELGIAKRVTVINKQFTEAGRVHGDIVTCRALDKFTEKLPQLLRCFPRMEFLLFGGPALKDALNAQRRSFREVLLPNSERRFLFVVKK